MNNAAFFRHKVMLIAKHADPVRLPARDTLVPRYERIIAQLVTEDAPTKHWRDTEYDLNQQMRGGCDAKKRKLINDELTKKFGGTSVGKSDDSLVRNVLKRGSIETNAEGQRIRDLLSDFPEEQLSAADEKKLALIFEKWEQRK